MSRVHPNVATAATDESTVLTVWRKSLLFNCEGFTVFDFKGDLIFRMDNYGAGNKKSKNKNKGEFVLMNADGKPLLTIRRKKLSLFAEQWLVYEGEEAQSSPLLSVTKGASYRKTPLARVKCRQNLNSSFAVEGSYAKRSVSVYDGGRRKVAEIKSKEAARGVELGADVFRLVVQPGFDCDFAMAVVVVLEQMFQSGG